MQMIERSSGYLQSNVESEIEKELYHFHRPPVSRVILCTYVWYDDADIINFVFPPSQCGATCQR